MVQTAMISIPSSPRTVVVVAADDDRSGQINVLFPWKLHEMLKTAVSENKESVVSWLDHGKAFKVHNVPEFVGGILSSFFKQTKYKSFQRQLNLWGFERIQNGPEKGAYYHPQFIRDDHGLCRHLTRQRAKKFSTSAAVTSASSSDADSSVASAKKTSVTKGTSSIKKPSATKKASPVKKQLAPPAPEVVPSASTEKTTLTRKVSESSLEAFDFLLEKFDSYYQDPLDLAEFEGYTFHLLEQDRYEELNMEFKFKPAVLPQQKAEEEEGSNVQNLLLELEQGVFGIPRTAFEVRGHDDSMLPRLTV
jgi:hypothetical protein